MRELTYPGRRAHRLRRHAPTRGSHTPKRFAHAVGRVGARMRPAVGRAVPPQHRQLTRRSNRITTHFDVGVLLSSAVESSGISGLVSG